MAAQRGATFSADVRRLIQTERKIYDWNKVKYSKRFFLNVKTRPSNRRQWIWRWFFFFLAFYRNHLKSLFLTVENYFVHRFKYREKLCSHFKLVTKLNISPVPLQSANQADSPSPVSPRHLSASRRQTTSFTMSRLSCLSPAFFSLLQLRTGLVSAAAFVLPCCLSVLLPQRLDRCFFFF